MRVRTLPGVRGVDAQLALRDAVREFQNLQGRSLQPIECYNEYLRVVSNHGRVLAQRLSAGDLDRVFLTPRYWMLHTLDPGGKAAVLALLLDVEIREKVALLEDAAESLGDDMTMFKVGDAIVIPDTNALIHHPTTIEHIPWLELVKGRVERVILAIPILVVDELDNAKRRTDKIGHGGVSVRDRARVTLRTLEEWFKEEPYYKFRQEPPVHEGVLVLDDPTRQRLPRADDELIDQARAIADVSGKKVTIASNDAGLRLRAAALGVDAVEPPGMDGPCGDPKHCKTTP